MPMPRHRGRRALRTAPSSMGAEPPRHAPLQRGCKRHPPSPSRRRQSRSAFRIVNEILLLLALALLLLLPPPFPSRPGPYPLCDAVRPIRPMAGWGGQRSTMDTTPDNTAANSSSTASSSTSSSSSTVSISQTPSSSSPPFSHTLAATSSSPPPAVSLDFFPWTEPMPYALPYLSHSMMQTCTADCAALPLPTSNSTEWDTRVRAVRSTFSCTIGCLCSYFDGMWVPLEHFYPEDRRAPFFNGAISHNNSGSYDAQWTNDSAVCYAEAPSSELRCSLECTNATLGRAGFWPSAANCSLGCQCSLDGKVAASECRAGERFTDAGTCKSDATCQQDATCQDATRPFSPGRYLEPSELCYAECRSRPEKTDQWFRSSYSCGLACNCNGPGYGVRDSRCNPLDGSGAYVEKQEFGVNASAACTNSSSICTAPTLSSSEMCEFQCMPPLQSQAGWTRSTSNCSFGCLCSSNSSEPATVLTCESGYLETVDPVTRQHTCTQDVSVCGWRQPPGPPTVDDPPPPPPVPPPTDGGKFPVAAVAAGSAVVLILLACAAGFLWWWRHRSEEANVFVKFRSEGSKGDGELRQRMGSSGGRGLQPFRCFKLSEIHAATRGFHPDMLLGSGGFGAVYKGVAKGRKEVWAVKRVRQRAMPGSTHGDLFEREVRLVAGLSHKNVIRLLGFCVEKDEQILVYEYIERGSLADALKKIARSYKALDDNITTGVASTSTSSSTSASTSTGTGTGSSTSASNSSGARTALTGNENKISTEDGAISGKNSRSGDSINPPPTSPQPPALLGDGGQDLTILRERLRVALGVAEGLRYLHGEKVIHRDIKPDNILLGNDGDAKLADFGFVKELSKAPDLASEQHSATTQMVAGTRGYTDPQYFQTFRVSPQSDVYSFGVVLLELATGRPAIITNQEDLRLASVHEQNTALAGNAGCAEQTGPAVAGSSSASVDALSVDDSSGDACADCGGSDNEQLEACNQGQKDVPPHLQGQSYHGLTSSISSTADGHEFNAGAAASVQPIEVLSPMHISQWVRRLLDNDQTMHLPAACLDIRKSIMMGLGERGNEGYRSCFLEILELGMRCADSQAFCRPRVDDIVVSLRDILLRLKEAMAREEETTAS